MKYKIFVSKNGVVLDEILPLILLGFGLVLILGYVKVSEASTREKIIEDIIKQNDVVYAHETLIEYLKMLDEKGNNKIDFLSKSMIEKDYESIKKDMKDYFDKKLSNFPIWRIDLYESQNFILSINSKNYELEPRQYELREVASVTVPLYSPNRHLSIKLFIAESIVYSVY